MGRKQEEANKCLKLCQDKDMGEEEEEEAVTAIAKEAKVKKMMSKKERKEKKMLSSKDDEHLLLSGVKVTERKVRQESARDRWVQQPMEEVMKHLPTDLEVLPSPLLLEQMEGEAVQCRSPPAPLAAHSDPAVKPSPSSRRKKHRRGAPSCGSAGEEVVSLPVDVRAAASKPASSSATANFPRLPAAPPMPSSLAPARCSEATPDELEADQKLQDDQPHVFLS
ncbi:hypothetical protein GOODEAATRI_008810 [Goodea atripinnis]|uniref:Uncharacterized protein n=1 Tax=Goodea atripinnis TaxID=208336 RepID=A0ABV0P5B4_9TELE